MQNEITQTGDLLKPDGSLAQVGWMRQPLLDTNLEKAKFYSMKTFQRYRIKRWDYYAVFHPGGFFSATIADLGYAGNIFVYILDFNTNQLHEQGIVVPLARKISLPRNCMEGESLFQNKKTKIHFWLSSGRRYVSVDWPEFHSGRGIQAEIELSCPSGQESMTIVIPIENKRFYYNAKINCLPAAGRITYGEQIIHLTPDQSIGSLDWGRGVWQYRSYWNWASASGFLPDGRTIGLNLGAGFGDTSQATENCLVLDGYIHKLDLVPFVYNRGNFMETWCFQDNQGRMDLRFDPFKERVAKTNLGIIRSEVHQLFGRYHGWFVTDQGERITLENLVGFAEEHRARW